MSTSVLRESPTDKFLEGFRSLYDKAELPSYKEIFELCTEEVGTCDRRHFFWKGFLKARHIHNLLNREFIESLALAIRKMDSSPIVEICAGDGELSRNLRLEGIDIISTDDYSYGYSNNSSVKNLDHIGTLERYSPEVVIACWPPVNQDLATDIMTFPTVKYYLRIGDPPMIGPILKDYDKKGWEVSNLREVEAFSLSAYDFPGKRHLSKVRLFERTGV